MTLLRQWTTGLLSRTQTAFSFDWEVRIEYPQSDRKLAVWRRKRLLTSAEQAGRQLCLAVWEHCSEVSRDQIGTQHKVRWVRAASGISLKRKPMQPS